jgi:hypothetical protein
MSPNPGILPNSRPAVTPTQKLSDYWKVQSGNTVNGQAASLKKYGPTSRGNFLDDDTQAPLNEASNTAQTIEKVKGNKVNVKSAVGGDKSAKLLTLMMGDDMFDEADRRGIKTAADFATNWESLKNSSARTREFSRDPKFITATQTEGADLKNIMAQHYANTVKARDAERAAQPQTSAAAQPQTPIGPVAPVAAPRIRVNTPTIQMGNNKPV